MRIADRGKPISLYFRYLQKQTIKRIFGVQCLESLELVLRHMSVAYLCSKKCEILELYSEVRQLGAAAEGKGLPHLQIMRLFAKSYSYQGGRGSAFWPLRGSTCSKIVQQLYTFFCQTSFVLVRSMSYGLSHNFLFI